MTLEEIKKTLKEKMDLHKEEAEHAFIPEIEAYQNGLYKGYERALRLLEKLND